MAMGICSDDDFLSEVNRLGNKKAPKPEPIAHVEEKKDRGWNGGKTEGPNVPDSLRKVIGASAIEGGSKQMLARMFGVSESSVSAYKNGATSTASYHEPDRDLKSYMRERKAEVSDRAREKLLDALDGITPDKLSASKARDLAGIAKDMSAVIQNMEQKEADEVSQTTIVFYSPKPRLESDYDVIEVKE